MNDKDVKSLEHTTRRGQYHVVFAPKYCPRAIYGELKKDSGWILRKSRNEKGIEIIEAEACPDHIYMLLGIPPNYSISTFIFFAKGKVV